MQKNPPELPALKAEMTTKLAEIIDRLAEDQLEHFSYAFQQIADCYLNSSSHGALLIANETDESQSLVAINASENQISEMVAFMADAMQGRQSSLGGMYIN